MQKKFSLFGLHTLTPELQPVVFNEASYALYNNYWLNVNYRNAGGKAKEKTVMPLGLAQHGLGCTWSVSPAVMEMNLFPVWWSDKEFG